MLPVDTVGSGDDPLLADERTAAGDPLGEQALLDYQDRCTVFKIIEDQLDEDTLAPWKSF